MSSPDLISRIQEVSRLVERYREAFRTKADQCTRDIQEREDRIGDLSSRGSESDAEIERIRGEIRELEQERTDALTALGRVTETLSAAIGEAEEEDRGAPLARRSVASAASSAASAASAASSSGEETFTFESVNDFVGESVDEDSPIVRLYLKLKPGTKVGNAMGQRFNLTKKVLRALGYTISGNSIGTVRSNFPSSVQFPVTVVVRDDKSGLVQERGKDSRGFDSSALAGGEFVLEAGYSVM